jgi:uncharacterized protein YbaP (TraB family)
MRPVLVLLLMSALWAGMARTPLADETPFQHGVLWKISRAGLRPSYLFGTFHIPDPQVLALPQAVLAPLAAADSVTIELQITPDTVTQLRQARLARRGHTLDQELAPGLLAAVLDKAAGYGLGRADVLALKPWALADVFAVSPASAARHAPDALPLDLWLRQEALRRAKPQYGLETTQEQIDIFDGMPLEVQTGLLQSAVAGFGEEDRLAAARKLYLARDIGGMVQGWRADLARFEPADAALLDSRFLLDRNRRMVQRMARRLFEGNAFIAVGALHLPGDGGLLQLLQQQGYTVTAVY